MQSHAVSSRNFVQNLVMEPKHAKFDQNLEIGHVRTCQDLSLWAHNEGTTEGTPIEFLVAPQRAPDGRCHEFEKITSPHMGKTGTICLACISMIVLVFVFLQLPTVCQGLPWSNLYVS